MDAIWQWGIGFIHTVQLLHAPALDAIFKTITFMGEEKFFLVLLPLLVWCVDLAVGMRVAFAFLLSAYVNTCLKDLFTQPRPFVLDPTVKLHEASGYGLPSGHSQSAVVVWGVIAAGFRKTWLWVTAILLMALIGFSRVYLGVHFPSDVLGGWAVGAVFLGAYLALQPRVEDWLKKSGVAAQLALAVAAPLLLTLLHPTQDTISSMAVLMGTGVGFALLARATSFSASGPAWQVAIRFLVGMAGVGVLYVGLSAVFPTEGEPLYAGMRFVRYALLGLWVGLGAPWLFIKLRLAATASFQKPGQRF